MIRLLGGFGLVMQLARSVISSSVAVAARTISLAAGAMQMLSSRATMKYHVIFNPKSGAALSLSLTGDDLVRYFGDAGCHAAVDATDDDLTRKIERALASDAEVIVSAGGDGTATAIARSIVRSKKSLALLPLGTANLLARDLGVPLDIKAAIGSMGEMAITEIDAGEVNGQLFLHKVVVGVIPAMAAAREKARGGNLFAVLRFGGYLLRRLRDARKTAIAIVSRDTENRVERIHAIAVANNAYDQGWGKVFCRSSLVDGMLTLYVLRRLSVGAALRLALEMLTGRWQEDQSVSIETVRSVALHAKRNKIAAMIDGEVEMLDTPLNFRIRPKVLRVLAPVVQAPKASLENSGHADRPPLRPALRTS